MKEAIFICLSIWGSGIILSALLRELYRAINKVIGKDIWILKRISLVIFGGSLVSIFGGLAGCLFHRGYGLAVYLYLPYMDRGSQYTIFIVGLGAPFTVIIGSILFANEDISGITAGMIVGGIVGLIGAIVDIVGICEAIAIVDTGGDEVLAAMFLGGFANVGGGMIVGIAAGGIAPAVNYYIFSHLLTPFLILLIYRRIICNNCLRYTEPLRSTYNNGTRRCEHCKAEVERTKECGKVIFTFGNYQIQQGGNRMFILSEPPCEEFYNQDRLIDLSEVYIDTKTADKFRIEQFITYILNYPPPKYGLTSVGIFYKGNLDDLAHLKNSILNNFDRVAKMGE
ncbi:MAG: hypothetical protein AB1414_14940 [bacterium]